MAFPELSHSPVPLREAEADALILALPPLPATSVSAAISSSGFFVSTVSM